MENWFYLGLIALVLWGVWGFFPKLATQYIDAKSVLIFQVVGSIAISLLILITLRFRPEAHPKGIAFAFLTGISGTIGFLFFLYSISRGKASVVVTMTALYPLVTILLSFLILKESITLRQGIGLIFAIIAMLLFSG